jgi:hypothetical protein
MVIILFFKRHTLDLSIVAKNFDPLLKQAKAGSTRNCVEALE